MKIKVNETIAVVIVIAVLVLGVTRLEIGQPVREDLTRQEKIEAAQCLPKVEVAAGSEATLALQEPEDRESPSKAKPKVDNVKLQVYTTGPFDISLTPTSGQPDASSTAVVPRELRLEKSSGPLELRSPAANLVLRRGNVSLLLQSEGRFALSAETLYVVTTSTTLPGTVSGNKLTVPAGTLLGETWIKPDTNAGVTVLRPLLLPVAFGKATPILSPLRVTGEPGLADISLAAVQSGLDVDRAKVSIAACALSRRTGDWVRAGVTQGEGDKVKLVLRDGVLPGAGAGLTPVKLAIASSDGANLALGGLEVIGRARAALIATVLTIVLLAIVMYSRGQHVKNADDKPRWFAGLFIGPDGDPSLSLLQVFIWSVLTVWGFFYVYIVAGNLLVLTPEMLGLLGIAGAGSVLARWIAASGAGGGSSEPRSAFAPNARATPQPNDFWTMLSTGGNFDLLKLQMFVFTVVIALYVLCRIVDAAAFPALDANTLLLLGVSQGVYITGKLASRSGLAALQTVKAQMDLNGDEVAALSAKRVKLLDEKEKLEADAPSDKTRLAAIQKEMEVIDLQITKLRVISEDLEKEYESGLAALKLKPSTTEP